MLSNISLLIQARTQQRDAVTAKDIPPDFRFYNPNAERDHHLLSTVRVLGFSPIGLLGCAAAVMMVAIVGAGAFVLISNVLGDIWGSLARTAQKLMGVEEPEPVDPMVAPATPSLTPATPAPDGTSPETAPTPGVATPVPTILPHIPAKPILSPPPGPEEPGPEPAPNNPAPPAPAPQPGPRAAAPTPSPVRHWWNRTPSPLTPAAAASRAIANSAPDHLPAKSAQSSTSYSAPSATISAVIRSAAKLVGMDVNIMFTMAGLESNFNPNAGATTSSARGLFQFISDTWAGMVKAYGKTYGIGIRDVMDPRANAIMAALFLRDNSAQLQRRIGRKPTATDLYIAHFLGLPGALIFFANLDKIAAQILPNAARSNPNIFWRNGVAQTGRQIYAAFSLKIDKVNVAIGSSSAVGEQYSRASASGWVAGATGMGGTQRPPPGQTAMASGSGTRGVGIENGYVTADKNAYFS